MKVKTIIEILKPQYPNLLITPSREKTFLLHNFKNKVIVQSLIIYSNNTGDLGFIKSGADYYLADFRELKGA